VQVYPIASLRLPAIVRLGLALLCLGACSHGAENVYRSSNQQRLIGDATTVTVTNVTSEAQAQPFAEQHCHAYGKVARLNRMLVLSYHHVSSNSAAFDCVTPAE
jgi:hypothetical protein